MKTLKQNNSYIVRKIREGAGFYSMPLDSKGLRENPIQKFMGLKETAKINPHEPISIFLIDKSEDHLPYDYYGFFKTKGEFLDII